MFSGGRVPGEIIGILDLDSESPDCPQLPLLSRLSVFLRLCCVCVCLPVETHARLGLVSCVWSGDRPQGTVASASWVEA